MNFNVDRRIRRATGYVLLIAFAVTALTAQAATRDAASNAAFEALKTDVAAISKMGAGSNGKVGVAAWRLDGQGPQLLQNADEPFPMGSTFKIAVAGAVFKKIDSGQSSFDKMITIDQDKMVSPDVIAKNLIHPGIALSVHNLLELMLMHSDTTATDYMVEEAGGPAAVTAWVRSQGVQGLRVDGGSDPVIRRFYGVSSEGPFRQAMADKVKADPSTPAKGHMPDPVFDNDPRDTTSVRQMGELLTKIVNGKALSPSSTQVMIAMMKRCQTGVNRLRAMMPPDTVMLDKTGTIGGTVNDIGVVFLPENAGNILIGVYIKASDAPVEMREKTIAEIARSVRDFYFYQSRN